MAERTETTRVRTRDGTFVKIRHPVGATDEQILAFARQEYNSLREPQVSRVTVGPTPAGAATASGDQEFREFVAKQFEAGNPSTLQTLLNPNTLNVTPEQGRKMLPMLAGTAASAGAGGILSSALLFGAGAGGGELLKNTVGGDATIGDAATTAAEGSRDALIGGAAFKALSPVARFVFGRAPTTEGRAAIDYATRRSAELADEARALTPSGQAVPSAARDAMERGAPRLPLDSITDGALLDGAKMLLTGALPANARAKQAAQFINRELATFTGQVPKTASVVQDAKQLIFSDDRLRSLRQFDRFDGDRWVDEIVTSANATALAQLARASPELHRQILAKNLENTINSFSRNSPELGLRVIDGQGLRKWFEANRSDMVRTYGFGTATKMDDFTNYAQHLDTAVAEAERGVGGALGKTGAIFRSGLETGGIGLLPKVVLPFQASAWALGNTLMNPSSTTFRFFAALPKAGRAVRTGMEAGSASAEVGSPLGDPSQLFQQFQGMY